MRTRDFLDEALTCLSVGDINGFFNHLDSHVEWTIESIHPATGKSTVLYDKNEIKKIFDRFEQYSEMPLRFRLRKVYETAEKNVFVVQLDAIAGSDEHLLYENHQCWIMKVGNDPMRIVSVIGYIDSLVISNFYQMHAKSSS